MTPASTDQTAGLTWTGIEATMAGGDRTRQVLFALRRPLSRPVVWAPVVLVGAVGLLVLLLGPVAYWATPAKHLQGKDKADARNATRQTLLAAVGGLAVLTGAGFTARTFFLTRRGQLTDRYTKAIAQLASEKVTERLGGIYALEHLMAESDRDHSTVVEVLAAFIREQTRSLRPTDQADIDADADAPPYGPPAIDVQAALTVLGRRPPRDEPRQIDLSQAFLQIADLRLLRLDNVQLDEADLRGADLRGVRLRNANLCATDLRWASMDNTEFEHVNMSEARLAHARCSGVSFSYVSLYRADLTDALLHGADLRTVRGLTGEQLQAARVDRHSQLPPGLSYSRPMEPPR